MKRQSENDNIWINHHDLDREENLDIKAALFGNDMLFDVLTIDKSNINAVQQYEWKIEGDEYEKCKELDASQYVQSPQFTYHVDSECVITFHFNFYCRMSSDDDEYCAIFVEIDEMPEDMKRFNIEFDVKCNERKAYRQLMRDQELSQKSRSCGFRIFNTSELDKNTFLEWTFGVKIFKIRMVRNDDEADNAFDSEFHGLYTRLSAMYI